MKHDENWPTISSINMYKYPTTTTTIGKLIVKTCVTLRLSTAQFSPRTVWISSLELQRHTLVLQGVYLGKLFIRIQWMLLRFSLVLSWISQVVSACVSNATRCILDNYKVGDG